MKHPGRWIWLLLLIPIAIGLTRLHFDVEVFDLLPNNLEAVEGLKLYQKYFSNARELIVTLQAENPAQAETTAHAIADKLRGETNLVSSITWEPPWLEHPEQTAELVAYLWFNQPPDIFGELTNRLAATNLDATLTETRERLTMSLSPEDIARLSYDPFGLTQLPESASGAAPAFGQGQNLFASSDGTFRILFVQARGELRTYRDCDDWLKAIKGIVQPVIQANKKTWKISAGYTGRPAFVAEVANGMRHDMIISVFGTAAIIALLFWLAHKRVKPMLWLLALLAAILGSTLALGGLIYGTINVVSMGFAAILLGLAVDYAVVHYQEALAHPNLSIPQIRHAIAPSIFWAAITTISAFLVLNFGGLPGLGQLGTLVGLGVALAACIMIFEFLPPLFPNRKETHGDEIETEEAAEIIHEPSPKKRARTSTVFVATAFVVVGAIVILWIGGSPPIDPTANSLRPRNSPSYAALDQIQTNLNQKQEPLWLIVSGETERDVAQRLNRIQPILNHAVSNSWIDGFTLATPLWPRPEFQKENRATAIRLAGERELLQQAAKKNGFNESSLALTDRILDVWKTAAATEQVFWPHNPMSQWIFEKLTAHTPTNNLALGFLKPPASTNVESAVSLEKLRADLPRDHVWLSGWELLGAAIFSRVKANMWKVLAPMIFLVLVSLWMAFRRPREILLSLCVLVMSGLVLLAAMRLAHWSWNLLNLMAIPLILGTGVDYSIFMQLALKRYDGDLKMAYRSVGRALLLCGGTAVAGFGSLGLSSNAGMASLGRTCAIGIAANMLIAIFLLPNWWHTIRMRKYQKIIENK
ncbi:MAG TPA: MMPL family transporter [Verrucomicrobiae bacterium]|nr:MMPL family transporter [Verrucomicrobiae bacterium]